MRSTVRAACCFRRLAPRIVGVLVVGAAPLAAQSAPDATARPAASPTAPAWAMPIAPGAAPPFDSVTPRHVPNSTAAFTEQRLHDRFNVADWFPASHPVMPAIVARGRPAAVWACGFCHMPDGAGRPENAALAGLPAEYMVQQLAAMRAGTRTSPWHAPSAAVVLPADRMRGIADSTTVAEGVEAAHYFASVRPRRRARVVEAVRIPRVRPAFGLYFLATEGGDEPLDSRLIEVALDAERHELRDAGAEYVAYVPPGSLARGRALATHGVPGRVASCASCHGSRLRGVGLVPPLAGRSPSSMLRQLFAFAAGTRSAPAGAPMRTVAAALSPDDMIAAVAYAASLSP